MRHSGRLHRLWWRWSDIGLPLWVWRPYCWVNGHTDDSYGTCVYCLADLGEKP